MRLNRYPAIRVLGNPIAADHNSGGSPAIGFRPIRKASESSRARITHKKQQPSVPRVDRSSDRPFSILPRGAAN